MVAFRREIIEKKRRVKPPLPDTTIPVYKKVSTSGQSRYLSVTKIIPVDWIIVEVTTVSLENNVLTLRIRKVA
jgi:hypothetical protein